MFSISNLTFQIILITFTFHFTLPNPNCLHPKFHTITQKLDKLTQHQKQPKYTLIKLHYIIPQQIPNNTSCINEKKSLLSSSYIQDGQNFSYPFFIKYCNQYISIYGSKIASFNHEQNKMYFVSSGKNDFTYFVEILDRDCWEQSDGNNTAIITKLQVKGKKTALQTATVLQIPTKFGKITSFVHSFSITHKLFTFTTNLGYLLFYKPDGKLQNYYNLFSITHQPKDLTNTNIPFQLQMIKLNNYLAVYTTNFNQHSFIFTINLNSRNKTMIKYSIPLSQQITITDTKIILKYNEYNFNEFYLKAGNTIYVYQQKSSLTANFWNKTKANTQMPIRSYSLLTEHDEFHLVGTMLIIQSALNSTKKPNEPYRYYYNLTDNTSNEFPLPNTFCPHSRPYISTASQTPNSHFLCTFCPLSYQCYQLHTAPSTSSPTFFDASKLRVPLFILSIAIIIFISFVRNRKSNDKSSKEDEEEQQFMKQLQRRDKKLYEQLDKSRNRNKMGNKGDNAHHRFAAYQNSSNQELEQIRKIKHKIY